ncbi:MAG TPA: LysM peptidoglycan-binding domain-containing protein, partial [Polyangia bacterium]|nr:LysM peptidoglycan-binding domain-containing protein [Polyangia bacterium]
THVVAEGETLWDIARAYGVSVDAILERSGMSARDGKRLRPGATLRVPGATGLRAVETAAERKVARASLEPPDDGVLHFLEAGQTLWDLARTYGVTVDALMERNALGDSEARQLRAGQHLVIPGVTAEAARRARDRSAPASHGVKHVLAPDETIWDLARRYGVSVSEIMVRNDLSREAAARLTGGSTVFVPGVEQSRAGKVARRRAPVSRQGLALARRLGLGTRRTASSLLSGQVDPGWLRAAGGKGGKLPGHLRWPVTNGWFVRGFGSGAGGYHLAVDIAGEIGWNVRAAAPGVVGYSGDEIKGYGNLVLVIHPGGWVTLYAHNSVNFVAAGEQVTRGQIIAELGSTGISRGPHVHFELLYRGQNCDPALLFKPGIRHRSGKLSPLPYAMWADPAARPRGLECRPRRRYPGAITVETEAAELDPAALESSPAP